jgi:hypothetical protein
LLAARFLCTLKAMAKQEKSVHSVRKKLGRPPGRAYGETIPVRLTPEMMAAIDRWATNSGVSRSESIRRLVEQALSEGQPKKRR